MNKLGNIKLDFAETALKIAIKCNIMKIIVPISDKATQYMFVFVKGDQKRYHCLLTLIIKCFYLLFYQG